MIIKMHFENLANKFSFKFVLIISVMIHNEFKVIMRIKKFFDKFILIK